MAQMQCPNCGDWQDEYLPNHCEACGHDWDGPGHANLRASMSYMSIPSEQLVRPGKDETEG